MVRILNGEIVADDDPRLRPTPITTAQPRSSVPFEPSRRLLPDTQGRFGSLSQYFNLMGYEIEYIWILALMVSLIIFGWRGVILIFIILWIYQTNYNTPPRPHLAYSPTQLSAQNARKDAGKFMSIRDVRGDKMN
jgi:hypothetical protein